MWIELARGGKELCGWLPAILIDGDLRPISEQANDRYAHGGGWRPQPGWKLNTKTGVARYPEDPPYKPVACAKINDETLWVYHYGIVAAVQPDGSYEFSRMD